MQSWERSGKVVGYAICEDDAGANGDGMAGDGCLGTGWKGEGGP